MVLMVVRSAISERKIELSRDFEIVIATSVLKSEVSRPRTDIPFRGSSYGQYVVEAQ